MKLAEAGGASFDTIEVTVVIPCLNEAETLETCIRKAQRSFKRDGVAGEVVMADNGSEDGSQAIAERLGARVVNVTTRGYGSALLGGIAAARGRYVIMGDADDSYDFENLKPFIEKLREGFELVMGNRFRGGIKPGAMPPLHRYFGNPLLSAVGWLFFHSPCADFHCGLRGFDREAITRLNLQTTGMEFASEMVVKATLFGLRIAEVPTTLSPDGRSRPPHLRSWRDGWRHLRFLLLFSPRWLFLYPGVFLMVLGLLSGGWLMMGPRHIAGVELDVHTLLYCAALVLIGFQAVNFAVFTKTYASSVGLLPKDPSWEHLYRFFNLERGLIVGSVLCLGGLAGSVYAVVCWWGEGFGPLQPTQVLRVVIPSVLFLIIGVQIVLSSFFLSVLAMARRKP